MSPRSLSVVLTSLLPLRCLGGSLENVRPPATHQPIGEKNVSDDVDQGTG